MATLSKPQIIALLQRLGELAVERRTEIELLLLGGAAMVLEYEHRLSTRDVDIGDARRLLSEHAKKSGMRWNLIWRLGMN